MKTLYLSEEVDHVILNQIEDSIGREMSVVLSDDPAINVYTEDNQIIEDTVYWLKVAGIEVLEIA